MKRLTWVLGIGLLAAAGCQLVSISVPDVVGLVQSATVSAITNAGLTVGTVTEEYSATVPPGKVIRQSPPAGNSVLAGSVVNLVLSKGPQSVTVPDVVGLSGTDAYLALSNAGLALDAVAEEYSDTVPAGRVISQNPPAGNSVSPGSTVDLVVSKGPQFVTVPNVVGLSGTDAFTALSNAGLSVGTVAEEYSATVPAGKVISQNPIAGNNVSPSSAVDLVLSRGGTQPGTVPNVVGMTQAAAAAAITSSGLTVGTVAEMPSATVPAGNVISQSPLAGNNASPGSAVDLVLSKGPQPVTVPNVVGLSGTDAFTALTNAGLAVGTVAEVYSDAVPAGRVISQNPLAGNSVSPGSAVNLVVSKGPQSVTAPDVVGLSGTDAFTALSNAGLTVGTVTEAYSATVPAGKVISQNPPAGNHVSPGSAVNLVVSRGTQPGTVPNVVGMTQAQAAAAITGAGLTVGTVAEQTSTTVPAGRIISQDPPAGNSVPPGSAVDLIVSKAAQIVTVPDVVGLSGTDAFTALSNAGLSLGTVAEAYSAAVPAGSVFSQSPLAGNSVPPGTAVNLVVSRGPQPVTVPGVVGMTQATAETTLLGAGLTVGVVSGHYSATVPVGGIISQSPPAGDSASPGSAVDLVVSTGAQIAAVPDLVGLSREDALAALSDAGLAGGTVTEAFSAGVPAGNVISQSPLAGDSVPPGTTVDLVVSKGPQPVIVPNVVGLSGTNAFTAVSGAGLTVGTVTEVPSATVPAGSVISQSPLAGDSVPPGTAVDLVMSKGVQIVTVPDVVGMSGTDAFTALSNAGLALGTVTEAYSSTVPAGRVISQSPLAGNSVSPSTAVNLVTSLGPRPVPVPNVVGMTQADAETAILGAGLAVGVVSGHYSATVPVGGIISQSPPAGESALPGSAVDLVVSSGTQVVTVPNLVGLSRSDAFTALTGAGLAMGTVAEAYSATVPAGSVISQSPLAGDSVPPDSAVDLVMSRGPQPVTVPNVVGLSGTDAFTALSGADLKVGTVTELPSATVPAGNIISQSPLAGDSVPPGTAVDLVVSKGVQIVTVPDVGGLSGTDAFTALSNAGLGLGTVTEAFSATIALGRVISQSPLAGDSVPPATVVNLVVSKGPQPVTVPDVAGMAQADAETALLGAGLTVGVVSGQSSGTVPVGSIISQNPSAGESVAPGTAVDLVVSVPEK